MTENRKTSIIILTYNNLIYNHMCIDSIRKYTKENTYELVVVDNNSTDGTREWLKEQKDIVVILNDENVGFPKGCNIGIAHCQKENDLMFLNNDTVVAPRWLHNLQTCLYSDDKIGATGPITNSCSNYQAVKVPYTHIKDMIPFAEVNNVSDTEKWEEKNRLVAFCMLVKREVINKIGIFDERFTPGNFEDDDLCMRIIEAGYKMMLCNDSFIHHFGSSSFNKNNTEFNNVLTTNRQKFVEKWGFNSNVVSTLKFDIIDRINEPKDKVFNVLEFDCELGATLLKLKYMYPSAQIYGIETNKSVARLGEKNIELITDEFEENYSMNFKNDKTNFFDYIIIGNRLQLSKDPWTLLNKVKKFLKPGGYVIATIPNLMHFSVVKELLKGRFMYNENSILNRSNNKFFTLSDIHKIFHECGYINPYVFHYYNELTTEDNELLNNICSVVGVEMRGHFLSYEYVAKFQKSVIYDGTESSEKEICISDLFHFKREEAMQSLSANKKALENYVYWMKNSILLRDYESASRNAYGFAERASLNHPGFYVSPEIENMLLVCADNLPKMDYVKKDKIVEKRKVLHVLSEGYATGGHTRLLSNWIEADVDSIHSLVTTWQIDTTPQWVLEKIKKGEGWIYSLATVSDKYVERAAELRKLAYEWADIVVLHMHMMDPIPVMAFGINGGPPIIYMNHGDHCFWLGASISDLVVDMRTSGQKLTLERRGCINSCILPIPIQTKKVFERNIIRQKYEVEEKETVILTIASNYKFRSINENNYINIIKQIVDKIDNCRAYIIGPRDEGKWHDINLESNGKIKALGLLTEIDDFYQIADVYLDCFMMGSMTSLLDAAIYGLSIIKFTNPYCPILTEFDEEFKVCSYSNVNEIIQEINEIKKASSETNNKYRDINNSIRKNHIVDTQDNIISIYNMVSGHKVNKELTINNNTEDYDLFWSLLIKSGYVF